MHVTRCKKGQQISVKLGKFITKHHVIVSKKYRDKGIKPVDIKYFNEIVAYINEDGVHIISDKCHRIVPLNKTLYINSRYPEVLYASSEKVYIKIDCFDSDDDDSDDEYQSRDAEDANYFRRLFGLSISNSTQSSILQSFYNVATGWSTFERSNLSARNLDINEMVNGPIINNDLIKNDHTKIYVNFDYRLILSPDLKYSVVLEFDKHKSMWSSIGKDKKNTTVYKNDFETNQYTPIYKFNRVENEKEFLNNDIVLFTKSGNLMVIGHEKCTTYDPALLKLTS